MGYHKLFSHRSFTPKKWFPPVSAFLGVISFNGDPLTYSLVHRIHHKYADTNLDPHSPNKGLYHSYIGWTATFKPKKKDKLLIVDLLKEWPWIIVFHRYELLILIVSYSVLYLISPFLFFTVLMACLLSTHYGLAVNAFGHNPKKEGLNKAVNNVLLSKIINPIFMHYTHHETPSKFDYSEGTVVDYSKYFKKFVQLDK